MSLWLIIPLIVLGFLLVIAIWDVTQKKHAILRAFPVVGHIRYWLESIGPELRQYVVADNSEERPFSRDQRRWVYASAKSQNPYFGFGTESKLDSAQHLIIRHSPFPFHAEEPNPQSVLPVAKVIGEWNKRPGSFRPESIVNVSAMSFGSLSGPAIEAINRGSKIAGCMQNTGEGGISKHHRHGGDLIYQLGTGYFGARGSDGRFSMDKLVETVNSAPVKMIEIKLSQGAKPGLGGVLPGTKVTEEVAEARGVPVGITVASPSSHREFESIPTMIDFIERIADATGLPVGIKSAVGDESFWPELALQMKARGAGPDFIAIDGGEGGTGAAPLVFSDHVALPFRAGFAQVFRAFAQAEMDKNVTFIGAGKVGFPGEALLALGLGADMIYVAREAMMAIGCIQAQRCHTGHCPTGIATHNKWFVRSLDPTDKAARLGNYVISLRHGLLDLAHACGESHPCLVTGSAVALLGTGHQIESLWDRYDYDPRWMSVNDGFRKDVGELMATAVLGSGSVKAAHQ